MKLLRVVSACALVAASLVRCVGDDSVAPKDGGSDAANDATLGDGSSDASTDSPPPPPTPDGSLAWFQHFNTSYTFEDLAVNEKTPAFVVAGGFATTNGSTVSMGSHQIGPSSGLADDLLATVNSAGVVWAQTQQPAPFYNADSGALCAAPQFNVDWFSSVAVDDNGTIYVAGSTSSNIFLVKNEFNGPQSFVAAFSATGTPLWEHLYSVNGNVVNGATDTFGTTGSVNNQPGKMQLAVSGTKLFVSFGFSGSLSYQADGGAPISSQGGFQDVFVGALDTASGSTLWHTTFGSAGDDTVEQIVTTSKGELLLTGSMSGTMTGPSGTGFPLALIGDGGGGGTDAYLVKLDGNGNAVYATAWGDPNGSTTTAASVAYANGLVAVGGYFYGAVDFGKGTVTAQAGVDGFLVVLDDATRKASYVTALAGSGDDYIRAVALDQWGDALVVGMYGNGNIGGSSSQLGASTLFPQTQTNVNATVIAKLSPTGTVLWSHALMPTTPDGGAPAVGIAMLNGVRARATNAGQLVVAGGMNSGADFGSGYQPLLSATPVVDYCHLVCFGGCKCTCDGPIVDSFVAAWQP